MVCASETLLWMSSISLSYGSSTPTHLEQTHTLQKSEASLGCFNKMQVGNTRLNSFIFTFQICTLIKYNQTNKYVLNADKKMDYPKSESSTCLKILHPRLNNQNTLKIFFLADKSPHQLCISNKKKKTTIHF